MLSDQKGGSGKWIVQLRPAGLSGQKTTISDKKEMVLIKNSDFGSGGVKQTKIYVLKQKRGSGKLIVQSGSAE